MKRLLVIAPHPDDETLGCGASLLRWRHAGVELHWTIVTTVHEGVGFNATRQNARRAEIEGVAADFGFATVRQLAFPSATLGSHNQFELTGQLGEIVKKISPDAVLLPFYGDAHSDHRAVFQAGTAATKSFRAPETRRILAYETISETEFGPNPDEVFRPNLFIDVTGYIDRKIEIMSRYGSELGSHPFPRSERAIRALALLRGAQAGVEAAEAFVILKEIDVQ